MKNKEKITANLYSYLLAIHDYLQNRDFICVLDCIDNKDVPCRNDYDCSKCIEEYLEREDGDSND